MFILYLSSRADLSAWDNHYGYYTGKCYIKDGESYPITDKDSVNAKQYISVIKATKSAESLYKKCPYVAAYRIEEI